MTNDIDLYSLNIIFKSQQLQIYCRRLAINKKSKGFFRGKILFNELLPSLFVLGNNIRGSKIESSLFFFTINLKAFFLILLNFIPRNREKIINRWVQFLFSESVPKPFRKPKHRIPDRC